MIWRAAVVRWRDEELAIRHLLPSDGEAIGVVLDLLESGRLPPLAPRRASLVPVLRRLWLGTHTGCVVAVLDELVFIGSRHVTHDADV